MQLRKHPARLAALIVAAVAAGAISGCGRVSTEVATAEYDKAVQAVAANKPDDALKAYQKAVNGEVQPAGRPKIPPEQVQTEFAEFSLAQARAEVRKAEAAAASKRATPDFKKAEQYVNASVQAFTMLAQQFGDKKVDTKPAYLAAYEKTLENPSAVPTPAPANPANPSNRVKPANPATPQMTPEAAAASLNAGQDAEKRGDKPAALDAYSKAMRVDFPDRETARTSAARVALALGKTDLAASILKEPAPAPPTSPAAAPGAQRVVKEWIGSPADHKGDFLAAEEVQDRINHHKFAYQAMDRMVAATGRNPWYSAAFALLIFTVVIKIAMTPLTKIQFHSTRKMTAIQPKMKALQEMYKDKPEEINRRVMALYKEEGVNPFGCGATMLIQFPILIALYQVIRLYNYQFRDAYFLWVNPSTAHLAPGFIGANLAQPDMILLGLYAISMFLSQKLTVMPAQDDQQRQQQMMMAYVMPVMFLVILKSFPSAFVLYWLLFNVFTTWQQWHLLRQHPLPAAGDIGGATTIVQLPRTPRSPDEAPKAGPKQTPAKRKRK